MTKKIIKKILFGLSFFSGIFLTTSAIVVQVPSSQGNEDINIAGSTVVQGDEQTVMELIQEVNKYLRFAIGAVCMGGLIYSGFTLMSASGNEEKTKKANNMLIGSAVGIIIAIISYTVVRLIVNLF